MSLSENHVVFRSVVLTSLTLMLLAALLTGSLTDWLILLTFLLIYVAYEMRWRPEAGAAAGERVPDHTIVRILRILAVAMLLAAAILSARPEGWLVFAAFALVYAAVELRWRWPAAGVEAGGSGRRWAMRALLLVALALMAVAAVLAGTPRAWLTCAACLLVYASFEWGWARASAAAGAGAVSGAGTGGGIGSAIGGDDR